MSWPALRAELLLNLRLARQHFAFDACCGRPRCDLKVEVQSTIPPMFQNTDLALTRCPV